MEVAQLINGYLNEIKKTKIVALLTFVLSTLDTSKLNSIGFISLLKFMFFLNMVETLKNVFFFFFFMK